MGQRTFDDFDGHAAHYRSVHTENIRLSGADSFYFAEMKVKLLRESEIDENLQVLDLGCGDGATALFMNQWFPHWKVTGIDVSEKSIAAAKNKQLPNAVFSVYNGLQTGFAENRFDVIFVAGVFHHIDHSLHDGMVKEIYRIMKKGGRLYFFEHNPINPITRHLVNTCVFDEQAKLLKGHYATKLLQAQHLRIRFKKFIIFFPRKGFLSKLIFLEKYLTIIPFGGQYVIQALK